MARTPDERFADLPGMPWEARYRDWEGLRLAHLDEGGGEAGTVVLLHGEPTWSYLWRGVLPDLLGAGLRCVAPDLPGFGRSDKPVEIGWYSYDRHVAAVAALLEDLDVRDATFVLHDWGGPIGMRVAAEHPGRAARLVLMNTGVFTGRQRMSETWLRFREVVERVEDPSISRLVRAGCGRDPGDAVGAAYDAPFPDVASKAGARAFPLILPLDPQDPGAAEGERTLRALQAAPRPTLVLWGAEDPVLPLDAGRALAGALGAPPPEPIAGASHFVQEDAGAEIGRRIVAWLSSHAS